MPSTIRNKKSENFQEGDYINWRHEGKWYRVTKDVNVVGGWAFFHLAGPIIEVTDKGERQDVFTIWHTVEHPYQRM